MGDLGPGVGTRECLQRLFVGRQDMVDGDIAIGVAVHLDAGAIDLVRPGIEVFLLLGEIALIRAA